MKTLQEIFNIVWERAKNKTKAIGPNMECKYRTPNGLKCFIGECIPDEAYVPKMEGRSVVFITLNYPETGIPSIRVYDEESRYYRTPVVELQRLHDSIDPSDWRSFLIKFADYYKLSIPQC